jgi:methionyl-tRNA formyltransferase
MGKQDTNVSNLKTLVVGCTPLARCVVNLLKKESELVGVVNLHPVLGLSKSNYDALTDICNPYWTKDINDKETETWITEKSPDVLIQCGWSQIFKKNILSIPGKYCIGIHPSPLPIGRGAAVINWKIIESDGSPVPWGNSLFVMEPSTDTGDIIDFEPFIIETRDDIRTAYQKVNETSLVMLKRVIPKIANGEEKLTHQDNSKSSRYYKRKAEDGALDVSWDSQKINDYVRGLTHPYPGAFLRTQWGKLTVWKSSNGPRIYGHKPGVILKIDDPSGILISAGDETSVWIERISCDGVEHWGDSWAKNRNIVTGTKIS